MLLRIGNKHARPLGGDIVDQKQKLNLVLLFLQHGLVHNCLQIPMMYLDI